MENQNITLEEFYTELASAMRVCFEGEVNESGGTIVYTAPNEQKFRIAAERIS